MSCRPRTSSVAALFLFGVACTDPFSANRADFLSTAALGSAFSSVPLGFSNVTSSFSGDSDGVPSMWLPGSRMGGFAGGLMGGGLGDPFAGGMSAGRGFGHHGPFGGRFGGGFTCTGSFNGATGRFVCDPVTREGLTITQSMAYANAAGAVQSAFDTLTTSTVNVRGATTGTRTYARNGSEGNRGHGPRHSGHIAGDTTTILTANTTVNHNSDRTVAGLAAGSTKRTVNATSGGTESATGTSSRGTFTMSRTAADTTKGLVVPIADGKPTYPTAGTVVRVMRATVTYAGTAAATTMRREVITYDGSTTAKVVITKDGVAQNCTMPLPRGKLTCA